jgi:Concanavalin A-like lectin/glucanases superfamily
MKVLRFEVCLLVIFILSHCHVLAADTNAQPRLTFELRDGSRIVGPSVEEKIKFHSALFGDFKLDVKNIRAVDCSSTNSALLSTSAGDTLAVSFAQPELTVKTSFGKVELPVDSIRRFTVTVESQLSGLVALWSGGNGGRDIVGGHDAEISEGITYTPAKTGPGFYFSGGPNRITIPDAPQLNFGAGQDFTIEGWIQALPPPPYSTDNIMTIVDKRETPDSARCLGYELIVYNGKLHLRMSDSINGNGGDWIASGPDLLDGQFHEIAVTVVRNASDGGKMYVDGQLVLTFDPTEVSGDLSNGQPLRIGNHSDPNYNAFFHGVIDRIAIYNRALSADEINSIYSQDNNGEAPSPKIAGSGE